MTTPARRVLMLLFLTVPPACAQLTTVNSSFDPLERGQLRVEAELTRFDVRKYEANGAVLLFPGNLDFTTATLRVAYAPAGRLALGVELPFRSVAYRADLGETALRDRAVRGLAVFAETNYGLSGGAATLRTTYFFSRHASSDPEFSAVDGVNRFSMSYSLGSVERVRTPRFVRFDVAYGLPRKKDDSAQSAAWLRAGIGRRAGSTLEVLLIGESGVNIGWEDQGTFHHRNLGETVEGGAMLQWRPRYPVRVRLSATRTLFFREGPEGVRVTLALERTFAPGSSHR